MNASACDTFEASGAIARYVAGTLDSRSAAELEDHFFLVCERCQLSIRAGVAVGTAPAARKRVRIAPAWIVTGMAATIACVFALSTVHHRSVRALGRVTIAPAYVGMPVRALSDDQSVLFDSAMTAYNRRDYATSADLLKKLNEDNNADVASRFFLGASYLMLADAEAAEASLTSVVAHGPSLYTGEAFYYRGLARLQLGRRADAISDLHTAASMEPRIAADSRRLLDRLED
jgi:tetratricopeptide (TPR) repeat protein